MSHDSERDTLGSLWGFYLHFLLVLKSSLCTEMVPCFQSETRLHASPYQHMLLLLQLWNVELKTPHHVLGTNWSLVSAGHNHSSLLLSDSILHLGGRTWFSLLHFSHSAFSASAALSLIDHTACLTASTVFAACTQRGHYYPGSVWPAPHSIPPSQGSRNTGGWLAVGKDQFVPASGPLHWLLYRPRFSLGS